LLARDVRAAGGAGPDDASGGPKSQLDRQIAIQPVTVDGTAGMVEADRASAVREAGMLRISLDATQT
jgi:hypothetical protein